MDMPKLDMLRRHAAAAMLSLELDGSRLQGALVRRTNGSLQIERTLDVTLSLDPLTNDAELVGREIRNHLDSAGIRERHCIILLPLSWVLMVSAKIPEIPEGDVAGFLQIEAERGFPCDVTTLSIAPSRFQGAAAEQYATLAAIPRSHLARLEQVLKAARLDPLSFTLGITALEPPEAHPAPGTLAMLIGQSHVDLAVECGGGVAALRALEGAIEANGGQRTLLCDLAAREVRITLGQLPEELRATLRRIRVYGPKALAEQLAAALRPLAETARMTVEPCSVCPPADLPATVPADSRLSTVLAAAARRIGGLPPGFEFLPPRVSRWQQLGNRYASRRLAWPIAAAVVLAVGTAGLFLAQEWKLSRLRSDWAKLSPLVTELKGFEQQTRQFRPWFDESLRSLSILRRVTEAFPEDGVVTAKALDIRDSSLVTCSGIARDSQALLKTLDQLRNAKEINGLNVEQIRGGNPLQFTFNFQWDPNGKP